MRHDAFWEMLVIFTFHGLYACFFNLQTFVFICFINYTNLQLKSSILIHPLDTYTGSSGLIKALKKLIVTYFNQSAAGSVVFTDCRIIKLLLDCF